MQILIKITGDKQTIKNLRSVKSELNDFSRPMRQIGSELKSFFSNDVFASQGGAIGHRWPALQSSTIKQKSARYRAHSVTPLIRTGAMKNAFYSKSDRSSVLIGNNASYFVYHQSSAPRTRIPYRPMIAISEQVKTIVNRVIDDRVSVIVKGF